MNDGSPQTTRGVLYGEKTVEWHLLNDKLEEHVTRVRRADAHRPSPKERFIKGATKKSSFTVREQVFNYSRLEEGEIRILKLYKSMEREEPLKADLFKRKLEDGGVDGRYEALSYCWGTDKPTQVIQIRDLNAEAPTKKTSSQGSKQARLRHNWKVVLGAITHTNFWIRRNLYDALKRLRSKYRDVYLWVDAICIDQSEEGEAEKQVQLAMMASIYNTAANVCVWLGEDGSDRAPGAFELIKNMMNYKTFDNLIQDPDKQTAWIQLMDIMKADWFSRRWIIQEIALSREASIHCGEYHIHWDDFADAVSLLTDNIDAMRSRFEPGSFGDVETSSAAILVQTLGNICRKFDGAENKGRIMECLLDVETLVSTLLGFHASFPRDTIYAVLSLAKDFPLEENSEWQHLHQPQLAKIRDQRRQLLEHDLAVLRECKKLLEGKLNEGKEEHEKRIPLLKELRKRKQTGKPASRDRGETEKGLPEEEELKHLLSLEAEDQLQAKDDQYTTWQVQHKSCELREQNLEDKQKRVVNKLPAVSLLPNYQFSPRDLFVAFVTRSIEQSRSLDIICRPWAPKLDDDDGFQELPTWVSCLSKAPYGMLGSLQGRQNGDNLVSSLPHDQRKRYAASATTTAEMKMEIDLRLFWQRDILIQESLKNATREPSGFSFEKSMTPEAENPTQSPPASVLHDTVSGLDSRRKDTRSQPQRLRSSRSIRATSSRASSVNNPHRGRSRQISRSSSVVRSEEMVPDPKSNKTSKQTYHDAPGQSNGTDSCHYPKPSSMDQNCHPAQYPDGNMPVPEPLSSWSPRHWLSGVLSVKGFVLGTVKEQSDVMRGGVVSGEWVHKLGWRKDEDAENRVPDTLWRLLIADRTPQGGRPPQWYKRACLHGLVDGKVSDNYGNIHTAMLGQQDIGELTMRYFKRVGSVIWNRRIFEMDSVDGVLRFCLGPHESRVGDEVCILYGCSVPVLLRKTRQKFYEIIGEAYVHGAMDGEAMGIVGCFPELGQDFKLV
ncbi:putative ankyrin and HET domain protein [Cercophora samala]|uniref:Ankyrin and HET domain protein n=1 Tax=Cercophora samala TaxID=330535 RepID=A0AA39ZKP8_9PEZI|nr:putative ankyrin and HET domain protein [Cercophora samala]